MLANLERIFPKLGGSAYHRTSRPTLNYNCIAWAAGDDTRWWQPEGGYWPDAAPRKKTMNAYTAAFADLGYARCKDGTPEPGVEKIALYSLHGVPKHAARQLGDGTWSSKLGELDDISHALEALEGDKYGEVAVFLARRKGQI